MDFKALAKREAAVIEEVGDCILSCLNPIEAIEAGDCFGISLCIQRPEAAVVDPSRLIIIDIVPTYMTVDSFLESAKFKLMNNYGDDKNVHGGFTSKANDK
jgi:hypothetical protein